MKKKRMKRKKRKRKRKRRQVYSDLLEGKYWNLWNYLTQGPHLTHFSGGNLDQYWNLEGRNFLMIR